MLENDRIEVKKALSNFGRKVVVASRTNFLGKNVSGKGSRSIDYDLEVFPQSFHQSFEMEDYMLYQDKGVSGTKKKYNTPYSYRSKGGKRGLKGMPPPSAFDKWSIRRGLAGRDGKGRFLSRKSLTMALAISKFYYGTKPTLFFTKAFKKEFKSLPDELIEAYALDVERFMESTLNGNR